ncbi:hypothetical protein D3C87_1891720 [compost metagenome]
MDDRIVAERGDDVWAVLFMQPFQRGEIEVIIVIMGNDHDVDGRQVFKGDAGRDDASGAYEGKRTGALRPDRVGQNIEAADLDQQ